MNWTAIKSITNMINIPTKEEAILEAKGLEPKYKELGENLIEWLAHSLDYPLEGAEIIGLFLKQMEVKSTAIA